MRDTKPKDIDHELPELTDKQRAFVDGIAKGLTKSDAYRQAYNVENMADTTVWANASRLASSNKVQAWLALVKREGFKLASYSVDQYVKEQRELYQMCIESGNMGAAAKVQENMGKVAGYYVTQIRDLTPKVDKDLIQQLESLFGPEMAQIAAKRMGYKDDRQTH